MIRDGESSLPPLPLAPLRGREGTTSASKRSGSCGRKNRAGALPRSRLGVQRRPKAPSSPGAILGPVGPHPASQLPVLPRGAGQLFRPRRGEGTLSHRRAEPFLRLACLLQIPGSKQRRKMNLFCAISAFDAIISHDLVKAGIYLLL